MDALLPVLWSYSARHDAAVAVGGAFLRVTAGLCARSRERAITCRLHEFG
jgi:hypothetical protein